MQPDANVRMILRAATARHHQRVDDSFSAFTLSDRVSYSRFLRAQAAAHLPVEEALETGGIGSIVPGWAARRRNEYLLLDLSELELDVPAAVRTPVLDGPAALLGALYVLEGSRLGGTLLRRQVAPGLPTRFLDRSDSAAWRELLAQLDIELNTALKRETAIKAAGDVFDLFHLSAQLASAPGSAS